MGLFDLLELSKLLGLFNLPRLFHLLGAILLTYVICSVLSGTFFMIQLAGYIDNLSYEAQGNILTFTTAFGFLNSLLNPIIYATKIPCVKQRFRNVFCCKKATRRQSIHSMVYSTDTVVALSNRRKHSSASLQYSLWYIWLALVFIQSLKRHQNRREQTEQTMT